MVETGAEAKAAGADTEAVAAEAVAAVAVATVATVAVATGAATGAAKRAAKMVVVTEAEKVVVDSCTPPSSRNAPSHNLHGLPSVCRCE